MRMLLILDLLVMAVSSQAAQRSPQEAAQLAMLFCRNHSEQSKARDYAGKASTLTLVHTFSKSLHSGVEAQAEQETHGNSEAAVYAFNKCDGPGFVMVSADDRTVDILCYSDDGDFNLSTISPDFLWWVQRYIQEIADVDSTNAYSGVSTSMKTDATPTTAIPPLLGNIAWDQKTPYNDKCPMDLYYPTERCHTGCVATAISQIMRFWKFPAQGIGNHSYTWHSYNMWGTSYKTQTLSLDFSTITFDWENMTDTYGSSSTGYTANQADAVATLMYACGVACNTVYGGDTAGGSGAWTDDMGYALYTYFGYKDTAKLMSSYSKSDYEGVSGKGNPCAMSNVSWEQTTSDFTTAFNAELEAGRPILMGGEDPQTGGHEFVCDGRDANGMFHINWGWSGLNNCYVTLSALKPSGNNNNYSNKIDAIISIEPGNIITGINQIGIGNLRKGNHGIYDISGRRVNTTHQNVNIVRLLDGTTKKIVTRQ